MITFEFSFDLPRSVPYAAIQDGEDTIFVINCASAAGLAPWAKQVAADSLTDRLNSSSPGTEAEIIDFEDLRAHRELRRAARAVQAGPRFMGSMLALVPLLVACAAPEMHGII